MTATIKSNAKPRMFAKIQDKIIFWFAKLEEKRNMRKKV